MLMEHVHGLVHLAKVAPWRGATGKDLGGLEGDEAVDGAVDRTSQAVRCRRITPVGQHDAGERVRMPAAATRLDRVKHPPRGRQGGIGVPGTPEMIGANAEAVRRAGVNTRLHILSVYVLSGAAAAIAGIVIAARLGSGSANAAVGFELYTELLQEAVELAGDDVEAGKDGDGVGDNQDAFPNDPNESKDSDGDGVGDNGDAFPNDPTETKDSDADGVGDNADAFPNDPTERSDSDGDGVGALGAQSGGRQLGVVDPVVSVGYRFLAAGVLMAALCAVPFAPFGLERGDEVQRMSMTDWEVSREVSVELVSFISIVTRIFWLSGPCAACARDACCSGTCRNRTESRRRRRTRRCRRP